VRTCSFVDVLIGEASQLWKREKASMAMCVCEEEKGCDEDCLNRCTWVECDEGNCNVPNNCSNRAFADLKERVKQGTKFAEGVEVILVVLISRCFEMGRLFCWKFTDKRECRPGTVGMASELREALRPGRLSLSILARLSRRKRVKGG
jgi:hypothetical protein